MGCAALVISILAVGIAVWGVYRMAQSTNHARVQYNALARAKGMDVTEHWEALVAGMKHPIVFPASNEADALRQLLVKRVDPKDILVLRQVSQPTAADDPLAMLDSRKKGR